MYHHRFDIYCCLGRGQWGPLAFKEPWAVGVLTNDHKIGENEKNSLFLQASRGNNTYCTITGLTYISAHHVDNDLKLPPNVPRP